MGTLTKLVKARVRFSFEGKKFSLDKKTVKAIFGLFCQIKKLAKSFSTKKVGRSIVAKSCVANFWNRIRKKNLSQNFWLKINILQKNYLSSLFSNCLFWNLMFANKSLQFDPPRFVKFAHPWTILRTVYTKNKLQGLGNHQWGIRKWREEMLAAFARWYKSDGRHTGCTIYYEIDVEGLTKIILAKIP